MYYQHIATKLTYKIVDHEVYCFNRGNGKWFKTMAHFEDEILSGVGKHYVELKEFNGGVK